MLSLWIFRSRQFVGANLATVAGHGGLGGATFLVVLQLQLVLGYSALQAGASLPYPAEMSARADYVSAGTLRPPTPIRMSQPSPVSIGRGWSGATGVIAQTVATT